MTTIQLITNFVMTAINSRYEECKDDRAFSQLMTECKVQIPLVKKYDIEMIVDGITYIVEIKEK